MINLNEINAKPIINYPVFWEYKVIFDAATKAQSVFEALLQNKDFSFAPTNTSKNGTYQGYKLKVLVFSESERLELFAALKTHAKFVI